MYYDKQIESKKSRYLVSIFDKVFIKDEVYDELDKKYFKSHYNGKPTKRYLRLKNKIDLVAKYIETFTVRRSVNYKKFGQTAIKYTMFNIWW